MRSAIISGASRYITGSDVYGSNTDCIGPNPNAAIHVAVPAPRDDSPSTRHKRPSAMAAAALVSTAYARHFMSDGPGRCSMIGAGRSR
jgi:hypothetical protein